MPKKSPTRISVIIPAFNEERLIGETLQKIRSAMETFSRRGWETELIVCDNNSTDRTAEIARAGRGRRREWRLPRARREQTRSNASFQIHWNGM